MDAYAVFFIAAVIGFGIGILSGLLGIGGGTIMIPVFRLGFGLSAAVTTATSLFTIIPTSLAGAVTHIRHRTCVPKLGLALGIGGACMSPLGVWLAHLSPGWAIMLAAACVIVYSAATMLKKAHDIKPQKRDEEVPIYPPHLAGRDYGLGVLIGLGAGLASGYVGVGGGFIMVPLMLTILKIPMKYATGTSLIAVMILAIPGTVEQAFLGTIDYVVGIAMAAGSIPGALVGARLISRVPERSLRLTFGIVLLFAALVLVLKEVGIFG
ncbi:MAG: sulfite exporter TauE/SafE family protein [Eggerthellaceae bacterium]|jgi:uncharacterized membrane protein YfcA